MGYLLDTHALLWFAVGDPHFPKPLKAIVDDPKESCFISVASLWEIAIKVQIGKLSIGMSIEDLFAFIGRNQIEVLQINFPHLLKVSNMPRIHGDPFDRLIAAQALSENLTLLSRDKEFDKYGVSVLW